MSNRRLGGVVLLVAVLLGSLLVARIGGVRIAGSAIAVPGAGAPRVGDCVREISGPVTIPSSGAPPPTGSVGIVGESSVSFSRCAEQHVGEVVAFRMTPGSTAAGAANSDWCSEVARGYQSSSVWRIYGPPGELWNPVSNHEFIAILSASPDYPWEACAVLAPGMELYSGSYVASLPGLLAPPAPFGSCRSVSEASDTWISCTSPHRVQEFGVAVEAGMSSRDAVAACRELIQAVTGLPDVNAGGLLKIQVVGGSSPAGGGDFGGADLGGADAIESAEFGRCRLIATGPTQLIGTLIGIGTGKLPLA